MSSGRSFPSKSVSVNINFMSAIMMCLNSDSGIAGNADFDHFLVLINLLYFLDLHCLPINFRSDTECQRVQRKSFKT